MHRFPTWTSALTGPALALLALLLAAAPAGAQSLLSETRPVSTGILPQSFPFTATAAGTVDVDVTNLVAGGLPALATLRAAVTRGDAIVGTPLTAAGRISFSATAGTQYVVRVFGRPPTNAVAGTVGIRAVAAGGATPLLDAVALFEQPATPGLSYTNGDTGEVLSFPAAGTYTATFADHGLPAALESAQAVIFVDGSPNPVQVITLGETKTITVPVASSSTVVYRVFLEAAATTSARGGLFGLQIVGGPSSTVVFDESRAVGELAPGITFANPAGGTITLQVRDAAFPAALAQVGAVLTAGGRRLSAPQVGNGAVSATAPAGTLTLWTAARAGAQPGTFDATVTSGGAPGSPGAARLGGVSRAVSSTAADAPQAFLFPFDVATSGAYRARVTDLQVPSSLQSIAFAVVQNGTALVQSTTGGTLDFNAASGPAAIFVTAKAPTGGSGLFGVQALTTAATPASLLDSAQAVGAVSDVRTVTVTNAGRYDVTLKDVGWPANFADVAVAITQGGQVVGRILNGGTFFFDAAPGSYLATIIAKPSAAEGVGLYSLAVAPTAPTVTLTANPTAIPSGQTAQLTWSSTAASGCTASGAWAGTKATSGNESVGPLTANSTYTLTCTGLGGSESKSVSVTVTQTPPTSSGGGGGGAFDLVALAALLALATRRSSRARRP